MNDIKRWLSALLALCMLTVALPAPALSDAADAAMAAPAEALATEPTAVATQTAASPQQTKATPAPTDAAEVKTIASFETVAPEGFTVPQGTLETDLGLPASLNAQFADGAAGEVAVAWQCAAGYDPSAEAGTQFAFAAVLPQGYVLAEGVSLPQILVTLTPPLANAMLMAEGIVDSSEGWELSNDGTLTVTGYVMSSTIDSFESAVKSIEVTGTGTFELSQGSSFSGGTSGSITIAADGSLGNFGTISGGTITVNGTMANEATISGGTFTVNGTMGNSRDGTITSGKVTISAGGRLNNEATISGGTITISTGGILDNRSGISGGTFTVDGTMRNRGTISDNTFTVNGTMENFGTISSGRFTVNGTINNGNGNGNGTITGGTFTISEGKFLNNSNTISGGTFTGKVSNYNNGSITGGDFTDATVNGLGGSVTGGTFSNFTMDSETGELTITGNVNLSNGGSLAPLTIALNHESIKSVTVAEGASFNAGNNTVSAGVTNEGTITGGGFDDALKNTGTVTGCQINGLIDNSDTIRGCTFGDAAKVEENTGTIYVTMTVNGLNVTTFEYDKNILSALETTFGEGKWYAVVGEEQAEISEDARFGLQKQTYACAYYTEDTTLYITAPTSVTEEMLAGVDLVIVMETGEITDGTFACRVYNMGAISGGTFEDLVNNHSTISGGTFKSTVENNKDGVISGGVFTYAIMENDGGTITGGVFRDFTMNSKTGELTITRQVDLDGNFALDPLTIGVNEVKSITVAVTGRFDAGSGSGVSVPVTNDGWINGGAFSNTVTNNAGSRINGGTFSGAVTNNMNGKITGGTFSSTVTNGEDGEISGGTFSGTMINNMNGKITGGTFSGTVTNYGDISGDITIATGGYLRNYGDIADGTFTISMGGYLYNYDTTISGGEFTILAGGYLYNYATIASGTFTISTGGYLYNYDATIISGGEFTILADGHLYNEGTISGGEFTVDGTMENRGAVSGGKFTISAGGRLDNYATISSGTFDMDRWMNNHGSITGGDFRAAGVRNDEDATVTGGTFVLFDMNSETDVLTITGKVDLSADPDALDPLTIALDDESIKSIAVAIGGTFNAGDNTVSANVTNDFRITGGTFTGAVTNNEGGEIIGGAFSGAVTNYGGITDGDFSNATVNNDGVITGGTFGKLHLRSDSARVQGEGDSVPTLTGLIENGGGGQILQPCHFGAGAYVTQNTGTIEVVVTVDGEEKTVNYDADILETLDASPTGLWYRVNADGTRALVKEGEAFASLQGEKYTSSPLLPKPEIEIDYGNESFSVTLAEEEVPEGVDVNDLLIGFQLPGQEHDVCLNMGKYYASASLSELGEQWNIALPNDEAIALTIYYALSSKDADGDQNYAYSELVEWVIPARPEATAPNSDKRTNSVTYNSILMRNTDMLAEYDFGVAPRRRASGGADVRR